MRFVCAFLTMAFASTAIANSKPLDPSTLKVEVTRLGQYVQLRENDQVFLNLMSASGSNASANFPVHWVTTRFQLQILDKEGKSHYTDTTDFCDSTDRMGDPESCPDWKATDLWYGKWVLTNYLEQAKSQHKWITIDRHAQMWQGVIDTTSEPNSTSGDKK